MNYFQATSIGHCQEWTIAASSNALPSLSLFPLSLSSLQNGQSFLRQDKLVIHTWRPQETVVGRSCIYFPFLLCCWEDRLLCDINAVEFRGTYVLLYMLQCLRLFSVFAATTLIVRRNGRRQPEMTWRHADGFHPHIIVQGLKNNRRLRHFSPSSFSLSQFISVLLKKPDKAFLCWIEQLLRAVLRKTMEARCLFKGDVDKESLWHVRSTQGTRWLYVKCSSQRRWRTRA